MRITFLGTGAAYSTERYNGAAVVDGWLLLDAGAPLLPHLHRAGLDPRAITVVFLTHFHGDHILGLPPFMLHRAFHPGTALTVVGPPGVHQRIESLLALSWGDEWSELSKGMDLTYVEARDAGEVAGVRYEAIRLDHGRSGGLGYRLHLGRRVLAYAGDTILSPPLDRLVDGADVAITEATSPTPMTVHTSWDEARTLAARHPQTRFIFNHVYEGSFEGAAGDLAVIDL